MLGLREPTIRSWANFSASTSTSPKADPLRTVLDTRSAGSVSPAATDESFCSASRCPSSMMAENSIYVNSRTGWT